MNQPFQQAKKEKKMSLIYTLTQQHKLGESNQPLHKKNSFQTQTYMCAK